MRVPSKHDHDVAPVPPPPIQLQARDFAPDMFKYDLGVFAEIHRGTLQTSLCVLRDRRNMRVQLSMCQPESDEKQMKGTDRL